MPKAAKELTKESFSAPRPEDETGYVVRMGLLMKFGRAPNFQHFSSVLVELTNK